ncbi:MAG: hypothetical protein HC828_01600 [Blastochloris sp.]|nr:hypothetical protein [Blastochloris sp.]
MAKFQPPFSDEQLPEETYGWRDAAFANHLARFIVEGFPEGKFTKRFYSRLMQEFGHIAHFNREGFWSTWFCATEQQLDFLRSLTSDCWTPMERAVRSWVIQSGLIAQYQAKLAAEIEARERAILVALKAKYEPDGVPVKLNTAPLPVAPVAPAQRRERASSSGIGQMGLGL